MLRALEVHRVARLRHAHEPCARRRRRCDLQFRWRNQHVLLARYDPGAGIGWHRDRPQFEDVVGISLGAPAIMRFRQRTDSGFRRAHVPLEPRSAYLLSGEVRHDWEHSIAPGKALRFSITFRTLSAKGRRLAGRAA